MIESCAASKNGTAREAIYPVDLVHRKNFTTARMRGDDELFLVWMESYVAGSRKEFRGKKGATSVRLLSVRSRVSVRSQGKQFNSRATSNDGG